MWFLRIPAAVIGLVTIALLPATSAKPYPVPTQAPLDVQNATQLEKREQCAGVVCGFIGICCEAGLQCSTNALNQATCVGGAATADSQEGSWVLSTTVYTATDLVTRTSVWSVLVPQATSACGASRKECGSMCCESDQYCSTDKKCVAIAGNTPGLTATGSPTATVPFSTPIPTGANGTLLETNQGGGGLSGGAIAGIVIGVILGVILLLLICFYCCAKAAFDTILACFGLGKKRRRTHESTYIEEHHHHSGSAAAGGRRWYGQAGSSRPSRPPKKSSGMANLLGLGAGLAGLATVLGMKRKHDRRHDDKSTTVTDSSYYYSDYTSSSSASSDRRTRNTRNTRNTRHSSRRR